MAVCRDGGRVRVLCICGHRALPAHSWPDPDGDWISPAAPTEGPAQCWRQTALGAWALNFPLSAPPLHPWGPGRLRSWGALLGAPEHHQPPGYGSSPDRSRGRPLRTWARHAPQNLPFPRAHDLTCLLSVDRGTLRGDIQVLSEPGCPAGKEAATPRKPAMTSPRKGVPCPLVTGFPATGESGRHRRRGLGLAAPHWPSLPTPPGVMLARHTWGPECLL